MLRAIKAITFMRFCCRGLQFLCRLVCAALAGALLLCPCTTLGHVNLIVVAHVSFICVALRVC